MFLYFGILAIILISTVGIGAIAHGQTIVTIQTDNTKYVSGTPMKIFGSVYNITGEVIQDPTPVIIQMRQLDYSLFGLFPFSVPISDLSSPESTTITLAKNGTYSVSIIPPAEPGHYEIRTNVAYQKWLEEFSNSYIIEIQELFFTRPAYILYIGGTVGFLGLIIIILKAPKLATITSKEQSTSTLESDQRSFMMQVRHAFYYPSDFFKRPLDINTYTILRFVFLSILAVTPILAIVFTDVQISPNSPLGLIIKSGDQNNTVIDNQWVVNIGGIAINDYATGIQIPVSVIIFGIAGSYLRFLYYTSTKESNKGSLEEPFYESLKDLSLFLLAPLLAIAVWLLLYQGGTTSSFTLAVISFTVGLVTREVVESLINFVRSKFSTQNSKTTIAIPYEGLSEEKTQPEVKIKGKEASMKNDQLEGSDIKLNDKEGIPKSN